MLDHNPALNQGKGLFLSKLRLKSILEQGKEKPTTSWLQNKGCMRERNLNTNHIELPNQQVWSSPCKLINPEKKVLEVSSQPHLRVLQAKAVRTQKSREHRITT